MTEIRGARTLVVGATGVLGAAIARALHQEGARVVGAGRDASRLESLAGVAESVLELDLLDVDAGRAAVASAADLLGGLDLVVVASGVAGFGPARDTPDAVTEELFAVNTLGPIAVVSAAVPLITDGGAVVVLSAVLADAPMAGMAAYSASKAAISAYLAALRREVRRQGIGVLDVRPPHMETGLAGRALAGSPPKLPAGYDVDEFVALLTEGIRTGARELVWDPAAKGLALR
jgi:NAD(P)-dependent dehydrogenase (short-subunit alcohol dehydrogenase family)